VPVGRLLLLLDLLARLRERLLRHPGWLPAGAAAMAGAAKQEFDARKRSCGRARRSGSWRGRGGSLSAQSRVSLIGRCCGHACSLLPCGCCIDCLLLRCGAAFAGQAAKP
jgi:hypothetical protein